jgi:hypothetical protein
MQCRKAAGELGEKGSGLVFSGTKHEKIKSNILFNKNSNSQK